MITETEYGENGSEIERWLFKEPFYTKPLNTKSVDRRVLHKWVENWRKMEKMGGSARKMIKRRMEPTWYNGDGLEGS